MAKLLLLVLLLVVPAPLLAASLVTPTLSAPLATSRFFDPERLLTNGGVKYSGSGDLTLEPEWGVGYRALEREHVGGIEESIHQVDALAGWRLSVPDSFYLSAAAKVPMLTIESAGRYTGEDLGTRHGYDFTRPFRNTLSWTSELGLHVNGWTDLTLYYDQSQLSSWLPGGPQQEERVGTRFIMRFE